MTKRLVICDLDNTLLFTDYLNSKSYIEAAKQLQINLPQAIYKETRITSGTIKQYCPNIDRKAFERLRKKIRVLPRKPERYNNQQESPWNNT